MDIVLKVLDVECRYGAHRVLQGVSMEIPRGAFLGIIGPNAAGKSTLLKTLAATLKPTRGVVYFQGEDIKKISRRDLARQVSVVPQESTVSFPFSARDVVMMGRNPHQGLFATESESDYAITEAAMRSANCWHLRDRSILELSGGERQRVILARALAQEPNVVLLDEPMAHLDLTAQLEILELLKDLNARQELTVLAVFHDLNLAAQFSSRLVLMREGKIFAAGAPEKVLTVDTVKDVYHTDVLIINHPLTGAPQVVLLPRCIESNPAFENLRVHLICGGGVGAALMGQLTRLGCQVSAGVLNIKDTDWEVAQSLGLQIAEEKPFSPVGADSYETNLRLALAADAVFLLEIPIGNGNLANVSIIKQLLASQKRCFLVDPDHLNERDYTECGVAPLVASLHNQGLRYLPDQYAVIGVIKKLLTRGEDDVRTAFGTGSDSGVYG